jgi:hypothetical protein
MQREAKVFTANLQSSMVSFTTHDDRDYLVAPCIALVPGVLNGDLVTMDAVAGTYQAWNGRPIVLNHPYDASGASVSANSPVVIDNIGFGQSWHADIDDNKLRVQVWLDIAKAKKMGGDAQRVVDRVRACDPVEVSTGYWAYLDEQKGIHGGVEYTAVVKQIIPDHLAMLPNATGACNWGDGCGIPRINQGEASVEEESIVNKVIAQLRRRIPSLRQQMTASDKVAALATLIQAEMDGEGVDPWRWHVIDLEDNYVIMMMDASVKRRAFTDTDGGNVALTGEWEDVFQQTTLVPVANQGHMCEACQKVVAHAEDDPVPLPEPDDSPPKPVPPPGDPVPGHVPGPDDPTPSVLPDTEEEDNDNEEDENMELSTQQAEILALVEQSKWTIDDIKAMGEMRANQRGEWSNVVKTAAGLSDADIERIPDSALKALAATYATRPAQGQNALHQENMTVYAARGLANPGSGTLETGPPRPQVLFKKAV